MSVGISTILGISAGLFAIGAFGLVAKRNLAVILMSVNLMFAAAVLALAAFSRFNLVPGHRLGGQAFAVLVALTSTGEVMLGLGLVRVAGRPRAIMAVDDLAG
ncbi:MAG TPA: NADH-quinone oxidoreductase subunit K [Candidatus Eisenbacteria bacterium]|jgi:NADH:ubiquinone oxidoreductase subunit K|nr:NADH-quinone oxidoreductase subunit K [Candidatus Eisenbacteria bacterium]